MGPTPLRPSWSPAQLLSRSRPRGVTIPIPVTTTRRIPRVLYGEGGVGPRPRSIHAGSTPDHQGGRLAVSGQIRGQERGVVGGTGLAEDEVQAALGIGLVAIED